VHRHLETERRLELRCRDVEVVHGDLDVVGAALLRPCEARGNERTADPLSLKRSLH
jgi:hypothetical protein